VQELPGIGGIESFEITIIIGLLLTGFEREQGTVSVIRTDIGNTAPE